MDTVIGVARIVRFRFRGLRWTKNKIIVLSSESLSIAI